MSDAIPLSPRPNREQYKKRAKDLVKLCRSGDRDALHVLVEVWIEKLVKLHDLDIALPREEHQPYTSAELTFLAERRDAFLASHDRDFLVPPRLQKSTWNFATGVPSSPSSCCVC